MREDNIGEKERLSRRQFLISSLCAGAGVAFCWGNSHEALAEDIDQESSLPILPPGAGSYKRFSSLCTSCHLCVSKCRKNVLIQGSSGRSTSLRDALHPTLDFDRGFCGYTCNVCSKVCPTQAIQAIFLRDKQKLRIGKVKFKREHCVIDTDDVSCGNCAIHCPTKAINMVEELNGKKYPQVELDKCIGCGSCQYHCPSKPKAMIVQGVPEQMLI